MSKPKLLYDGNCPICVNYIKLIQRKVSSDRLEYVPTAGNTKDFGYQSSDGALYEGQQAIDKMANEIPEIKEYFWMLPPQYRVPALQAAYKVGSAVRGAINKVTKRGCNCGR